MGSQQGCGNHAVPGSCTVICAFPSTIVLLPQCQTYSPVSATAVLGDVYKHYQWTMLVIQVGITHCVLDQSHSGDRWLTPHSSLKEMCNGRGKFLAPRFPHVLYYQHPCKKNTDLCTLPHAEQREHWESQGDKKTSLMLFHTQTKEQYRLKLRQTPVLSPRPTVSSMPRFCSCIYSLILKRICRWQKTVKLLVPLQTEAYDCCPWNISMILL